MGNQELHGLRVVLARRIGEGGLGSDLYAILTNETAGRPYPADFIETAKARYLELLDGSVKK